MNSMHACARGGQKRTVTPRTGVIDGCELPHKCWELSPSLLQEQHELFATEPPSPVSPIKTYLTESSCCLSQYARQKNGTSKNACVLTL